MPRLTPPLPLALLLAAALSALAILRPIDHDESQYVAAARLVAGGLLPYRDFAYLQTPLQPFAFAPVPWMLGDWAWPALRILNALLGTVVVVACWRAMREAGAGERTATACAALLASCDILLFAAGTARNDALPAALLAIALLPMLRAERGDGSRGGALLAGLLLAGAAAAKVSYALPAAAYGAYALAAPRHRPIWVALGTLPAVLLVAACYAVAPEGFAFGVIDFPSIAPVEYYGASDRAWKLSVGTKAVDTLKFLALGPALVAALVVTWRCGRRPPALLEWLAIAGLIAALLPTPTWRQYLLPALPPLFVLLARHPPPARGWRIALAGFALIGLGPSAVAVAMGGGLRAAMRDVDGLSVLAIDRPVATLSPQMLPDRAIPDARFATGPFYFRSRALLDADREARLHLVSRARLERLLADPPAFILVGGEGPWTSGDAALDDELERWAVVNGWRLSRRVGPRLRLYARSRDVAPSSASR